jgi:nucleotide-binding universal stress UspA family protein
MTTIGTILAVASDSETGLVSLAAACTVGRAFASHVEALHVRTSVFAQADTATMFAGVQRAAEAELEQKAAAAKAVFDEICRAQGIPVVIAPQTCSTPSAAWREADGREEDAVTFRGRLADLVVMARPQAGREPPHLASVHAALRETGRPLLLVPSVVAAPIGSTVVIAWNGSAEAARAVAAALPFIGRAAKVVILSAPEGRTQAPGGGDLATYFAWRGLDVACHTVAADGAAVGAALLHEAAEFGADLVVMGAYTHSRWRETILGGVTRHVLFHAEIPVLMCH